MIQQTRLTGREVLARMKRGDCPRIRGGYTSESVFDDGALASGQVMTRLHRSGKISPPNGGLYAQWTLNTEQQR